ncbi:MAG TPA: M20/M25/M40 family metallo-hydrolase [Vicinamibacterales bacterium]|nr:M20/M25/M40 family metallo-hydrolase [Vicinamibacterales bacterium]
MRRKLFLPLLLLGLAVAYPAAQATQERIDTDVNARIRKEGWDNSQIMRTLHYLTDVYGPRVTGSPNHENAAKWAVQTMEKWGFRNGKLEPFEFKTATVTPAGGWLNEKASGHIISPVKDNLVFEVLAWTPSTKGTVTGPAVSLITPMGPAVEAPVTVAVSGRGAVPTGATVTQYLPPTEADLKAYFAQLAPKVKGAMVFVGAATKVPFQETPPSKRRDDEQTKAQYNPDPNAAPGGAGRGGRGGPGGPAGPGRGGAPAPAGGPVRLTAGQIATMVNDFLMTAGAAVRVNDAGREHGQIRAFNYAAYDSTKTVPTVVLRNEDYGRITRILADGTPVQMEFTIVNRDYPAGKTSYNAVAEIPGSDKADEVVMLGGHLDSWHSATGATDNAAGSTVMMEAARIIQALGLKPRRTIRVALWGGEEQGLLGSKAYVEQHFGTFENPKPEFAKFNGYFNIDGGTGRIRGMSIFGPPEAAQILGQYLRQFEDFGIYGATAASGRNPGGTDSTSFNAAGLPGIGGGQDPMEYNSHTWHTNLDTYERIVEDDMKKSAIAVASAVYHLAMREQMLPRFEKDKMPAPPGGRGGGAPQQR